jgi:uncharacterized damage-inducible protein DinB
MPDTPQALAIRLREEGARVIDFFNDLSKEQWDRSIYIEGTVWTIHDLLAHFVSAEFGRKKLIIDVASGGNGAPPDFEIDKFNQQEVERLSVESNSKLIHRFKLGRNQLVKFVSALRQEDLDIVGNDPFLGEVPLTEIIKLTYRHLQIHLRDARRCI